jgi:hypothetical protein
MLALLRARYAAPAYAFLSHVRNGTGFSGATRTADALAMSTWASRGLHLYGFEIKSSRGDWLRELKDPGKADVIAGMCDFWFVVAGDESVVKDNELPPSWGLLVVTDDGGKLKLRKDAALLAEPRAITRKFLAAILRRAQEETATAGEIAAAVEAATQGQQAMISAAVARATADTMAMYNEKCATIAAFEETSGVHLARDKYAAANYGKTFHWLLHNRVESRLHELAAMPAQLTEVAALLNDVVAKLKEEDR